MARALSDLSIGLWWQSKENAPLRCGSSSDTAREIRSREWRKWGNYGDRTL